MWGMAGLHAPEHLPRTPLTWASWPGLSRPVGTLDGPFRGGFWYVPGAVWSSVVRSQTHQLSWLLIVRTTLLIERTD
jgi:hypothetical protein